MQAGLVTKKYRVMAAGLLIMAQITPKDNPNNIICDNPIEETYDFIIAGGGTAGSVLAARLSEDLGSHVLLLEAGVTGTGLTEWPALTRFVYDTKKWDWRFKNVRDEGYCFGMKGKVCKLSRGRMLGGQSAFNRMMYVRGNRNDYDLWEKLGNPGWGYGDVLPYFIRSEDNLDGRLRHSPYHGVGGPLKVSSPERHQLSNLASLWLKAAVHNKFEIGDINGDKQSRFMLHQTTTAYGERWSTARGYLAPASHRHNLDILTEAHVTRIIIDPHTKRAKGVVFYQDKKRRVAWARKEVIVSAGTFNSPQLLKLSGVGPCAELKKHGIFCKKNLPGVGENLQSHFGIGGIDFLVGRDGMKGPSKNLKNPVYKKQYVNKRIGPLASVMGLEGTGFISSSYNNVSYGQDWPDVQLLFFPQHISTDGYYEALIYGLSYKLWQTFYPNKFKPGFRIVPVLLRPRSRGRVALRSRNPWQHPDIFLNLFDDPHDLAVLREGGQKAEAMGLSLPFIRAGASAMGEKNRFCYIHPTGGPDWWDCRARVFPETLYQETSTCKMGPPSDPLAVVDSQLRVYGVSGLRVVDASIMPTIVSGDATAATVMIAERAADMIRAFWHGIELGNKDPAGFVEETVMNLGDDSSPVGLGLGFGLGDRFAEGEEEVVLGDQLFAEEAVAEGVQTTAAGTVATQTTEEVVATETTEVAQTVTVGEIAQSSSIVPETTAAAVTEAVQETVATQQTTQAAETTEPPKKGYTLHMGKVTPMSGTIMTEPVGTVAPTAEGTAAGAGKDGFKSATYGDNENSKYGDYDGFSEAELFGDFPGTDDGNYGGFLGPIRDYSGYPGQKTTSEEEYDGYADPEPTAREEYGAPQDNNPISDFGAPLGLDGTPDYGSPLGLDPVSDYGAPLGLDETSDYGSPLGLDPALEYGASLGLDETSDYGSPLGLDPASDYGAPLGLDETSDTESSLRLDTSDYGAPLGTNPASDYGVSLGTDVEGYGAPRESDIISDYGDFTPDEIPGYGAPLGSSTPSDYGNPLQDGPTSESDTSKSTSDFGGFGDYSIRSTVSADADAPPTATAEETTTSEKPAPGAGRLQANIKRLKEEMKKVRDYSGTAQEVIVTERPTPRFDARAGTTGEPRTYTSVYTDGLGDGMEDTFGRYKKGETDGSGRKREIVDKFVAEASVDHAAVFQRASLLKDGMKSPITMNEGNKGTTEEGGRDAVESRRKIMQARRRTAATTTDRRNAPQKTRNIQRNKAIKPEHAKTPTTTRGTSAPRRNAGRSGRRRTSSVTMSGPVRTVTFKIRGRKAATSVDKPASHSHRRSGVTEATSNRERARTWDIAIVTRAPKVKSGRTASRGRNPVVTNEKTSSRHPQSTVRSRLVQTEEEQDGIATFGSKRVRTVPIGKELVADTNAKRGRNTADKSKTWAEDDEDSGDDDDWREVDGGVPALDPSMWGMKNEEPL